MAQRNVSEEEVFQVLEAPDQKGLPTERRRFRWRRNRVQVIFEKQLAQLRIITVFIK